MAELKESFKDFQSPHEASVDRLVHALDRAYHRPGLLLWRSFLQGFMTAVGAFLGTFLVIIGSGYVLHSLGGYNLFKPLITEFQNTLIQAELKQTHVIDNQQ